jgi:hypothetical protein
MMGVDIKGTIQELMALYDGMNELKVKRDDQRALMIAHGWYMRLRRTGEAAVRLTLSGYGEEAAPLRRSMIEHAIGLYWLADAKDAAVVVLERVNQIRVEKLAAKLTDAWSLNREDLADILSAEAPSTSVDHLAHFANQCAKYGSPEIHVAWLTETASSHPSLVGASAYVDESDGERILLRQSSHPHDVESLEQIFAVMLLIASSAFNELIEGQPWTKALKDIDERLNPAKTG